MSLIPLSPGVNVCIVECPRSGIDKECRYHGHRAAHSELGSLLGQLLTLTATSQRSISFLSLRQSSRQCCAKKKPKPPDAAHPHHYLFIHQSFHQQLLQRPASPTPANHYTSHQVISSSTPSTDPQSLESICLLACLILRNSTPSSHGFHRSASTETDYQQANELPRSRS